MQLSEAFHEIFLSHVGCITSSLSINWLGVLLPSALVAVAAFSHCFSQRLLTEQSNPTEKRTRRSEACKTGKTGNRNRRGQEQGEQEHAGKAQKKQRSVGRLSLPLQPSMCKLMLLRCSGHMVRRLYFLFYLRYTELFLTPRHAAHIAQVRDSDKKATKTDGCSPLGRPVMAPLRLVTLLTATLGEAKSAGKTKPADPSSAALHKVELSCFLAFRVPCHAASRNCNAVLSIDARNGARAAQDGAASVAAAGVSSSSRPGNSRTFANSQVLVRFSQSASKRRRLLAAQPAAALAGLSFQQYVGRHHRKRPPAPAGGGAGAVSAAVAASPGDAVFLFAITDGSTVQQKVAQLNALPGGQGLPRSRGRHLVLCSTSACGT